MCRTHRYDHISLLHFCPGEVLQELVVRHGGEGMATAGIFQQYVKVEIFEGLLRGEVIASCHGAAAGSGAGRGGRGFTQARSRLCSRLLTLFARNVEIP